jgi:hypothetical protein
VSVFPADIAVLSNANEQSSIGRGWIRSYRK